MYSLSYFEKWRIEHALIEARDKNASVRTTVEIDGVEMRVLVSRAPDKEAILRIRERSAPHTVA